MKKYLLGLLFAFSAMGLWAQAPSNNTLLWKVTGKNLTKPSYLFGTIHLLCADDITLSDNLKKAIQGADKVYLELDLDNMVEMLSVMGKMKMRNDTTLADLLTPAEYKLVKDFFEKQSGMIPFSILEKYKPMLAASALMETSMPDCNQQVAMEQLIMREAKSDGKGIKGLETMAFQMSIFDSIPYRLQAKQLYQYVLNFGKGDDKKEFEELTRAYRSQELNKLEEITVKDDMGMPTLTNILLYDRNAAWAKKLDSLMTANALVVAVGAGHLPGDKGVINLLRKIGYTVEPMVNDMVKKPAEAHM